MGFQSQEGQIGFKTQAEEGTFADPSSDGVFVRLRSGALGANRELLIPDPEIGGSRDIPDAYLGPVAWIGDLEFYARTRSLATLARAAFGVAASATEGAGGAHKHTITPGVGVLPWLSIEEAIGSDFDVFHYTDAKVNTLHLEAEANGYLMGTAGMIARHQSGGMDDGGTIVRWERTPTPPVDVGPMVVGTNIFIEWAGVTLPAKAFNFDLNNNLEDDDFRLGSLQLGDVTEMRREFTASVTVRPEDANLWRQAVYGQAGAYEAGGLVDKSEFKIICESYELIGDTVPHSIVITAPQAILQPFELEPSGDDVIEHEIEVQFLRPDPGVDIATMEIVNNAEAIA